MILTSFTHLGATFLLSFAIIGTTTTAISNGHQVWADVFEGTEGTDVIIGTPEDDLIDSKGGDDFNRGDAVIGEGFGDGVIVSGEGDDQLTGGGGADIFLCGEGEDTVTDYNQAEGDISTPDCENIESRVVVAY